MPSSLAILDAPILVESGKAAPVDGAYEEVDSLGRATGVRLTAQKGEALPSARYGYRWRLRQP